jgi:diaminopimelate epimerase
MVFFVDNFDFDWRIYGAEVEKDRRFPEGTNVEYGVIKSRRHVVHRSWERGVGETNACASGAAAVVAAGVLNGQLDHKVRVEELTGSLEIEIRSLDDPIKLTGPSMKVAEGVFEYKVNG